MTVLDTDVISNYLKPHAADRYPRLTAFVNDLLRSEGLSIAFVTQFELRRGLEASIRRGGGRNQMVQFEKLLTRIEVLGLDDGFGGGWDLAARLWADGQARKPAVVFKEADLLIAATAAFHSRPLATCEARLIENLKRIDYPSPTIVVPLG